MQAADRQLDRRWQYAAYFALAIVALIFVLISIPTSGIHYDRFFGEVDPILAAVLASVLGAAALWILQARWQFEIIKGRVTMRGVALSWLLATALAVMIVAADLVIRYPADINVPVPAALLFYPAVGFVAEIAFHALPLALLLLVLRPLDHRLGKERVVWLGILIVAALEPTFQVLLEQTTSIWGAAYTWVHVFAIACLQLYVFRRFDFVSMYCFRLLYYAYWHVFWGVIRLDVLY